MNCTQARKNLVAYLDGEVSPQDCARIEEHLQSCPQCAADLERLRALRADLAPAVQAGLAQIRLSPQATDRIRARLRREQQKQTSRPRGRRSSVRWGALQAAFSTAVVLLLIATTLLTTLPAPVSAQETLVVAPSALIPGTDAPLRVIVREPGSARPIREAEVQVQLAPDQGAPTPLYQGRTDDQGTVEVRLDVPDYGPDRLEGDLVVHTTSTVGRNTVREPVVVQRSWRLHLTSDKPLYRPGQTISMRALALEAAHGQPAVDRKVRFRVQGINGETLFERAVPASAFGIAAAEYPLPARAAHGTYRLIAALGDTASSHTVSVGEYPRPSFKIVLQPDQPYYLTGETIQARIAVQMLDERPIPGAAVTLHAYVHDPGQRLVAVAEGRTGADGTWTIDLGPAPAIRSETATLALQASTVNSKGETTWGSEIVPLAAQALAIDVVAEGGRLRPGIENEIALLCSTPDGAPAPAALTVEIAGRTTLLQTDAFGLATLRWTPPLGERTVGMYVAAQTTDGRQATREVTLSADQGSAQVLLRLDRATYRSGESMHLEALVSQAEVVYFDVTQRDTGYTLTTHIARPRQGRAALDIDLSPKMTGVIEVHAYQVLPNGMVTQDTRLAVVRIEDGVALTVQPDRASYRPGEGARIAITSTVEGVPVQSALGISIVDESIHALQERAPGFAKLYWLIEDALLGATSLPMGMDLAALVDPPQDRAAREAQDQAARAAWSRLSGRTVRILRAETQAQQTAPWPLRALAAAVSIALVIAPVALGWLVLRRVRGTRAQGRVLRRTVALFTGLGLLIALPAQSALLATVALLSAVAGRVLLFVLAAAWVAVLAGLGISAARRSDRALGWVIPVAALYATLGALLGVLAERGAGPGILLSGLATLAFLCVLATLLALGGVLWAEGRRGAALTLSALALLLAAVILLAGVSLALSSTLARTVTSPQVFAGPVGWVTGCQAQTAIAPQEKTQATPPAATEATRMAEKEVEAQPSEPMPTPTPPPTATPPLSRTPPPTAQPSGTHAPSVATPTPAPPAPPPLLGPYAPETLYWAPEAITDAAGRLTVDLSLPDIETSWRVSVIASTRDGLLGSASARLDAAR